MEKLEGLIMQGDAMRELRLDNLGIVKDELERASLQAGFIEVARPLAAPEARDNWTGAISLDQRIESGELSQADVQLAIETLGKCYVPTASKASLRCVDGRGEEGYDDDRPEDFGAKLGPQTVAGTVGDAVDYRVAIGGVTDSETAINMDVKFLVSQDDEYLPADHAASHHGEGKTGCGGVDGVEEHEEDVSGISAEALSEIEGVLELLLGDGLSLDTLGEVSESAGSLISYKSSYFKNKNDSLDVIKTLNPEGVPVLVGDHKEILVGINMVPGTTLHRDHFSATLDGNIQAFNYDAWRSVDKAGKLFPDNPHLQLKYVHAQAARSVAALMQLTDGSLILAVRQPR